MTNEKQKLISIVAKVQSVRSHMLGSFSAFNEKWVEARVVVVSGIIGAKVQKRKGKLWDPKLLFQLTVILISLSSRP